MAFTRASVSSSGSYGRDSATLAFSFDVVVAALAARLHANSPAHSLLATAGATGANTQHLHEKAQPAWPGQVLVSAAIALHPHNAMLQAAAAQGLLELVLDQARQRRVALPRRLSPRRTAPMS